MSSSYNSGYVASAELHDTRFTIYIDLLNTDTKKYLKENIYIKININMKEMKDIFVILIQNYILIIL